MSEQEKIDGTKAEVFRFISSLSTGQVYDTPISAPGEKPVILIKFQDGPIKEVGVNGCQIEDVIDVLVDRLRGFQAGPFRCNENSYALEGLIEANLWLRRRTEEREAQGVEGTKAAHK